MPKPIRVMQIMGYMGGGGVEATIMNHYRLLDHECVQFDFVIQNDSTVVPEDEIHEMGGRIFRISSIAHPVRYMRQLRQIIDTTHPNIMHSNINALSVFPLKVAKDAGVPVRIAHSHSTANKREFMRTLAKNILRKYSKVYPTDLAACGLYSAEWLFGNDAVQRGDVYFIKNAIDLNKYSYNEIVRKDLREQFGLSNKFVIGQVGRFSTQKNHTFSLEVFARLHAEMPDAVLVLLGSGPLMQEMQHKAKALGLEKSVVFLGHRKDAEKWYSVFDVLLFPSLYEGIPLTGIEAQAANLHVVAADAISSEAFVEHNLVDVLSLNSSPKLWADKIHEIRSNPSDRKILSSNLTASGYDIHQSAHDMQEWYVSLMNRTQALRGRRS